MSSSTPLFFVHIAFVIPRSWGCGGVLNRSTTLVSSMKPPARIESLRVFDEDPSIRVILLETKLAAKGL